MALDLLGVQAKIERAYEHLQSLQAEVERWVQTYPYGLRHKVEDEGRRHSGTLEVYGQPDNVVFGLLIGDCAQNFRAALDHLVFAVARDRLTPADLKEAEDGLAFPITKSQATWTAALGRGRLKGVGQGVVAEIERRQPKETPDPSQHLLAVLHWLNNRDKHRLIHTIAAFPQPASIDFIPELPGPSEGFVAPPPYEDGTEVFWAGSAQPCPDVKVKTDIVVEVRIRDSPRSEDIRELLLQLGQTVQRIVSDVSKAHIVDARTHD